MQDTGGRRMETLQNCGGRKLSGIFQLKIKILIVTLKRKHIASYRDLI